MFFVCISICDVQRLKGKKQKADDFICIIVIYLMDSVCFTYCTGMYCIIIIIIIIIVSLTGNYIIIIIIISLKLIRVRVYTLWYSRIHVFTEYLRTLRYDPYSECFYVSNITNFLIFVLWAQCIKKEQKLFIEWK